MAYVGTYPALIAPGPYLAQRFSGGIAKQGTHGSSTIFQYSVQKIAHGPNTQILLLILVTLVTSLQGPSSSSANTHFDDQMDTLEAQTGTHSWTHVGYP